MPDINRNARVSKSPLADLYSVGAFLWSAFTKQDPIKLADPISNPFPVLPTDELPQEVDGQVKDLIAKALERDPQDRYRGAKQMVTILNQVLA